jgi:glycogen debranching enzyme
LIKQAELLRERFQVFWCDDLGTYALALDGDKRPCRVRSSNAGHCLFTGIADAGRAARVAGTLMDSDCFSGWGVRTLAAGEARYNPMAYHNGAVWPHDNALFALGCSRYGLQDVAVALLSGLFQAGTYFELHRMPELFCGFPRRPGEGPTAYPVAASPQAWAAGAVFLLLQACLGLGVNALESRIWFHRPRLPEFLGSLTITNLTVDGASVDLELTRQLDDVGVRVLRREGALDILIAK